MFLQIFTFLAKHLLFQEFHAEFITHPISYSRGSPGSGHPGQPRSPEQSPGAGSPSSPSNTLPSFIDTYTPSVVTIEPRTFGAEAEYENRLRHQKHQHHHHHHQQQQQQHHHQQQQPGPPVQQMTVKFHLKTEAPDTVFGPGRGHPAHFGAAGAGAGAGQYEYGGHQEAGAGQGQDPVFYLKKEPLSAPGPGHSYGAATPGSSPSPSPAAAPQPPHSQPDFVDFFHGAAAPPGPPSQLTTLTNYIPFNSEFSAHPHGHSHAPVADTNCPKFEADIESLNRVRRSILNTPQPM